MMTKLKVLDLFAGIGGFSLGLEATGGFETVAFCEIEPYPQKVLAKHWPNVPIYNDVRELTGEQLREEVGTIDVICGGFPCQDISTAGRQAGIGEGTRSGLWSECARLLGEIRPRYAIFENVTNLLNGERGDWFKRVLWDISEIGYDAEWHCVPASQLGAHHHRDRVWIVAYPNQAHGERRGISSGIQSEQPNANSGSECGEASGVVGNPSELLIDERNLDRENGKAPSSKSGNSSSPDNLAHTTSQRQQGQGQPVKSECSKAEKDRQAIVTLSSGIAEIWETEPELGRVVDGVSAKSHRHRLAALGNAVVPQIPEMIGKSILKTEN